MADAVKKAAEGSKIIDTDIIKAQNAAQFASGPDTDGVGADGADPVPTAPTGESAEPERTEPAGAKVRLAKSPKLEIVGKKKPSIANIRLKPETLLAATSDEQLAIPIGKPHAQKWFRVRPELEYQLPVIGLTLKDEEDGFFVVDEKMADELRAAEQAAPFMLYVVQTKLSKGIRVWPIRQANPDDGKWNDWSRTADIAAHIGMEEWVRLIPDRSTGQYSVRRQITAEKSPDPVWPNLTIDEIVEKAFFAKGKLIDNFDHPVLKQLT